MRLGEGNLDDELSFLGLGSLHAFQHLLLLILVNQVDETKAFGAARATLNNMCRLDFEVTKEGHERFIVSGERQVGDKNGRLGRLASLGLLPINIVFARAAPSI